MRVFRDWIYFFCLPLPAFAGQCAVDFLAPYTALGGDPQDKTVHVAADYSAGDYQRADFRGSVNLSQGDKHVFAPELVYQHEKGAAEMQRGGIFATPQVAIESRQGQFNNNQQSASFQGGQYYFVGKTQDAVGSVEQAQFDLQNRRDLFNRVTWTTCGREHPAWSLQAENLELNQQENRAIVRDMTLNIGKTPIFYLPYFTFPLSGERASGFLVPSASTSEQRGLQLSIPYYWNIAPNQDATFTFQPMSKRGLMVAGEYRFLGEKQAGILDGTFLPYDWHSKDTRWSIRFAHHYDFNDNWHSNLLWQSVSDVHYFDNFRTNFEAHDDWYLERHATLKGAGDWGELMLRAQNYLRIDSSVDEKKIPFSRLPQLTYHYQDKKGNFRYQFDAEAVHFQQKFSGEADRLRADGEISYRWGAPFGYVQPSLSLSASHYNLADFTDPAPEKTINRVLPSFSIDSGLIFEKDILWQGENWTQTIEPRLFYLYTPHQNQNNIPILDSNELSPSWNALFARNRFSGGDRIGDANQLTTAVRSSFYNQQDGAEKLRFAIGQVHYFQPQRVHLEKQSASDKTRSMLVSEGLVHLDRHWRVYGLSFWDTEDFRKDHATLNLEYRLDDDRFFSLSHHYDQHDYDQYGIAGVWRINPKWRTFFRQDYSARYNHLFNSVLGVEYNDCCWAIRLAGKQYRDAPNAEEIHRLVYLEFVLKGLGNMGSRSGRMLSREIHGFKPLVEENAF